MIEHIQKSTLEDGDIVHLQGELYQVGMRRYRMHCSIQCCMYDKDRNRCTGFCYRWNNSNEVIFRPYKHDDASDIKVTETHYQEQCRIAEQERIEKMFNLNIEEDELHD